MKCPFCGSEKNKHWSYVAGGNLPPGKWQLDECRDCGKRFNIKPRDFVAGKCPFCGRNKVEQGVYAGGGPDGHWEEDICHGCGRHFNHKTIYTE